MDDPYAFQLDPQLEKDTVPIADWHLCQVRLMNDSRYPWVILCLLYTSDAADE